MTMKHIAVGLTAIGIFSLVAAGRAKAEMLSLDCYYSGRIATNVWVDTGKSTVTVAERENTPRTYPAQITVASISWKWVSGGGQNIMSYYIDRTSGAFTASSNFGAGMGPEQCVKGTTPLPATKF
jgi:hypothetical protein